MPGASWASKDMSLRLSWSVVITRPCLVGINQRQLSALNAQGGLMRTRKGQNIYIVGLVEKEKELKTTIHAYPHDIEQSGTLKLDWADGMLGAAPAFTNKKKALAYARKHGVGVSLFCMKVN